LTDSPRATPARAANKFRLAQNPSGRHRHATKAIVFALCGALSGAAAAQAGDLVAALRAAQATDPTMRAARSTLDLALLKRPEARAALFPTVSVTANTNSTAAVTSFSGVPAIDRSGASHAVTLQLVQPLFRTDNFLATNQALFIVEGAQAQFEQAQQDLLLRVAAAYFALVEAHDVLGDADAQVAAMERQLVEISQGFDAGIRAITDVDDTKSRLGAARAQQIAAREDIANTQSDLERLTGTRYSELASLPTDMPLPSPQPPIAQDWIDQARTNNPQVRAALANIEVARLDVSRARSGHVPTMDLVANVGHNSSAHSLTTPEDYSTSARQKEIGIQVNIPLFAGGAIVTKVNQAEVSLEKAQADLDGARRDGANLAQHAFSSVISDLAQADALEIAVDSSERALKGNQAGFRVGYRTNVDVLTAQQQLFAARSSRAKARYEALLQGLKLKAAAGILVDADIEIISALMH